MLFFKSFEISTLGNAGEKLLCEFTKSLGIFREVRSYTTLREAGACGVKFVEFCAEAQLEFPSPTIFFL